ncbi:polygalacturonase [Natranaerovirga pectinivora]|uniref:Polygalacturonase n=1 Tax=Natranaerovirga pectinivora TaxID=682400 RepID=A0A4R3MK08_9FIRM|nr:glycoside hydrolase family 28 protein [Natranaerovirga pectinivora]TCT13837.1 polygalacturonase [Natranaerovirga pectinivora]
MNYNIILVTSRSVTLELENKDIYFSANPYNVYLDGKQVIEKNNKNVFSLYDLSPNTEYEVIVELQGEKVSKTFKTLEEKVSINVKDFGAIGDGKNDDTSAIQAAILSCPKDGRVFVPAGIYYVRPIFLKSDLTLEFEKNAVLLGSTDRDAYPILPGRISEKEDIEFYLGTWEGSPESCNASLITGLYVENVKIIGLGTLDGNAQNATWWENAKVMRTCWRPRTVFLNQCKNITIQGMTIQNSPSWTLHPYFSDDLNFIDINIINPSNSPNTDGLDPESCGNVNIIGVNISVGDDCIAIKSGKLYMGQTFRKKSENMVIRNCHMRHGHGAVVLGSEMSGGIANLKVEQCLFEQTDRGLRIKTRRGRGKFATVENVSFQNIKMDKVLTPFVVNMFYHCDPDGKVEYVWTKDKLPVDDRTPFLGEFHFEDIECTGAEVAAGYFYGLPEQKIKKVSFKNVKISFAKETQPNKPAMMCHIEPVDKLGIFANNVETVQLENIDIVGNDGEKVIIENCDNYINN